MVERLKEILKKSYKNESDYKFYITDDECGYSSKTGITGKVLKQLMEVTEDFIITKNESQYPLSVLFLKINNITERKI